MANTVLRLCAISWLLCSASCTLLFDSTVAQSDGGQEVDARQRDGAVIDGPAIDGPLADGPVADVQQVACPSLGDGVFLATEDAVQVDNTVRTGTDDLGLVTEDFDLGFQPSIVALRFENLPLSQPVQSARISFGAQENRLGDSAVNIRIENNTKSSSLAPVQESLSAITRPRVDSEIVMWGLGDWRAVDAANDPLETTLDLSDMLNALINRADWDCNNNAVTFFFEAPNAQFREAHTKQAFSLNSDPVGKMGVEDFSRFLPTLSVTPSL